MIIDDAGFYDALDELLKAAFALTVRGARVRIIGTQNGVDNLFNQYIQDARKGRKDDSIHRTRRMMPLPMTFPAVSVM